MSTFQGRLGVVSSSVKCAVYTPEDRAWYNSCSHPPPSAMHPLDVRVGKGLAVAVLLLQGEQRVTIGDFKMDRSSARGDGADTTATAAVWLLPVNRDENVWPVKNERWLIEVLYNEVLYNEVLYN